VLRRKKYLSIEHIIQHRIINGRTPKDESKAWVGVKIKTEPIKWTVE
jgi:hypothetical protein